MKASELETGATRTAIAGLPRRHWALRHLPAFPAVASRLLQLLNDPNASYSEFAEVIESDPSFSWEVLKAANSSMLGLPFEVEDIRHAVSIVGVERVKGLVLAIALSREFRHAFREPRLVDCWKHCLATAHLSADLSIHYNTDSGLAYTAGLLHDVGRIALMSAFPRKYTALIEESFDRQVDMRILESQFFEIDHCAAGAAMMLVWQLPANLREVCLRHHEPFPEEERSLLANVAAANRVAHLAGFQPVFEVGGEAPAQASLAGVPPQIFASAEALRKRVDAYCLPH
ncbi:MAG: HDOD domain-containing protein [Bryobacterales bacterium]|nr:HDOD domain-containing protein [Bryobacterales bacterium]